MRIWAVANQKGGVGKTTTALSLAGLLARREAKTLLVDLDPHGSLTAYLGRDTQGNRGGVYELFRRAVSGQGGDPGDLVVDTAFPYLYLLPASAALATLDRQLGNTEGMGLVLRRALKALEADYATVILDCPPVLALLVVNALAAAQRLIIPVQTEHLAIKGLERMVATLRSMRAVRGGRDLEYWVIPTMFDLRSNVCSQALKHLREMYSDAIWCGAIPVDPVFRESTTDGRPSLLMHLESPGVKAYSKLLQDLEAENRGRSGDELDSGTGAHVG